MITASLITVVLFGFVALPVLAWMMGFALRVFGWTIRAMFSILGILLLPIGLVVMAVVGIMGLAYVFAPFLLLLLLFSIFAPEG